MKDSITLEILQRTRRLWCCCLFLSATLIVPALAEESRSLKLGPVEYSIPNGFFYLQFGPPDGSVGWIAIRALLPDLQPLTTENAREFDPPAKRKNLVLAFIHYKSSLLSDEKAFDVWKTKLRNDIPPKTVGPFLVHTLADDDGFWDFY